MSCALRRAAAASHFIRRKWGGVRALVCLLMGDTASDNRIRRQAWISHYIARGQYVEARQLGWDGSEHAATQPSQPAPPSPQNQQGLVGETICAPQSQQIASLVHSTSSDPSAALGVAARTSPCNKVGGSGTVAGGSGTVASGSGSGIGDRNVDGDLDDFAVEEFSSAAELHAAKKCIHQKVHTTKAGTMPAFLVDGSLTAATAAVTAARMAEAEAARRLTSAPPPPVPRKRQREFDHGGHARAEVKAKASPEVKHLKQKCEADNAAAAKAKREGTLPMIACGVRLHMNSSSELGYLGVRYVGDRITASAIASQHPHMKLYQARGPAPERHHIGCFPTIQDAAVAYANFVAAPEAQKAAHRLAYAAKVEALSVLREAEGLSLHLSVRSSTGYLGVRHTPLASANKPYQARARGSGIASEKVSIGYFATAVEAAVAYAKHVKLVEEARAAAAK